MKIAFLGTGLGFVRRLRATGHDVNVWNRSGAKANALQADGARAFDEAQRGGVDPFVMPGVAALFDAAIARGEGALDVAAAARMPV